MNAFGFNQLPEGGFDPENDDHTYFLAEWDWEPDSNCEFLEVDYDSQDWVELLSKAINDSQIHSVAKSREITLVYADHDGPVNLANWRY